MAAVDGQDRSRPEGSGHRLRAAGQRVFGGIAGRYRALRQRVADMLLRGDRDYARLSALSQEIGRMRQKLRADLQRRRDARRRRGGADTATSRAAGGDSHEP